MESSPPQLVLKPVAARHLVVVGVVPRWRKGRKSKILFGRNFGKRRRRV